MNKNTILEAMYKVVKESTEWGLGEKDYAQFIDGVIAMTEETLEKEKEERKLTSRINALEESVVKYENAFIDTKGLVAAKEYCDADVEHMYPEADRA